MGSVSKFMGDVTQSTRIGKQGYQDHRIMTRYVSHAHKLKTFVKVTFHDRSQLTINTSNTIKPCFEFLF